VAGSGSQPAWTARVDIPGCGGVFSVILILMLVD
jgi:hypothetical protein